MDSDIIQKGLIKALIVIAVVIAIFTFTVGYVAGTL